MLPRESLAKVWIEAGYAAKKLQPREGETDPFDKLPFVEIGEVARVVHDPGPDSDAERLITIKIIDGPDTGCIARLPRSNLRPASAK